jgi:hypothetical protein
VITGSNPIALFDGSGDFVDFTEVNTVRTAIVLAYEDVTASGPWKSILSHSTIEPDFHRGVSGEYQDNYR